MPAIDKIPTTQPVTDPSEHSAAATASAGQTGAPIAVSASSDGTRALLQSGFWITLAGLLALLATKTVFGGIGIDGPHTDAGWLAFMFAMMGVPFGFMLLVLGGAKWLRNRHLDKRRLSGE